MKFTFFTYFSVIPLMLAGPVASTQRLANAQMASQIQVRPSAVQGSDTPLHALYGPAPLPTAQAESAPTTTPEAGPSSAPLVTFEGGQLRIEARNSTMSDVLNAVKQKTGAALDTPAISTERAVGIFGPGAPRDVMVQLLNGSHYNYVLLGSPVNPAALNKIVLTARAASTEARVESEPEPALPQASTQQVSVPAPQANPQQASAPPPQANSPQASPQYLPPTHPPDDEVDTELNGPDPTELQQSQELIRERQNSPPQ